LAYIRAVPGGCNPMAGAALEEDERLALGLRGPHPFGYHWKAWLGNAVLRGGRRRSWIFEIGKIA